MFSLSKQDIIRRLHSAGIAGQVQASQAVEAFRLYLNSEFPDVTEEDCAALFVRQGVLVIRSVNPSLMHVLREHETEIVRFIDQVCGQKIHRLQFRAN